MGGGRGRHTPAGSGRTHRYRVRAGPYQARLDSVSERFAPGTEKLDIRYTITDPNHRATVAKIEILGRVRGRPTVLHTITGIPHDAGTHEYNDWDGLKSDGKYISFEGSPYTVRVMVARAANFSDAHSANRQTAVELHSLALRVRGPRVETVGSALRVTFERDQRAADAITTPATFLVEGTVRFKSKAAGQPVTTPVEVRVDWSYQDPPADNTSVTNAHALRYVRHALNFHKTASTPRGDNCHKDRGGKRGLTSHHFFTPTAGFALDADGAPDFHAKAKATAETTGTFTVQSAAGSTLATIAAEHDVPTADLDAANAALVGATLAANTAVQIPKRGKSVFEFVTSSVAGDSYKVLAKVHGRPAIHADTGVITVFRKVIVGIVQEMDGGAEHCPSAHAALAGGYAPAFTAFLLPTPVVTNIALRNPLWPYAPGFPLIRRESYPPAPGSDRTYMNDCRNNSYNAEYQFEADNHAANSIQVVGGHILRTAGRPNYVDTLDAAGNVTSRTNTAGTNGEHEGGGWNTSGGGTNRIIVYHLYTGATPAIILVHEMGHLLNLQHQTNTGGGAAFPADHDPADPAPAVGTGGCLMRGDGKSDHLCGKCLLKLRGWNIHAPGAAALP